MPREITIKPPAAKRTILVLLCGEPYAPTYREHGDYHAIFANFFQQSMSVYAPHLRAGLEVRIRSYKVLVKGVAAEYPSEADLAAAHGLLLTGGGRLAFGEMAQPLRTFIVNTVQRHAHLRLFGVCFGMQVIARAMDGRVAVNDAGIELGVRSITLQDKGKRILLGSAVAPSTTALSLQLNHSARVTRLPPGFANLGGNDNSPVQFLAYPSSADKLEDVRILGVQGHPEYTTSMANAAIDDKLQKGQLDGKDAESSRAHAALPHDGLYVGFLMLKMLG